MKDNERLLQLIDAMFDNKHELGKMFKEDDPAFSQKMFDEAYSVLTFRKLLTEEDFFNDMWKIYMTKTEDEFTEKEKENK